jgi:hypothetical protein
MWNNKQLKKPLIFVFLVFVIGLLVSVFFWNQKRLVSKGYEQRFGLLKTYLRESRAIPTREELKLYRNHKEYLAQQRQKIIQVLQKNKDFSKAYMSVVRPLEFREILAQKREKLERDQLGFSDFKRKIPSRGMLSDLKRYLSLSEAIIITAKKNRIGLVSDLKRLKKEGLEALGKSMFVKYPLLVRLETRSENLMRFLYDLAAMDQLVLVEAVRIVSKPNYQLDVVLKITYVEIVASS